jgi:diguanylate cyclase (GGDEF)-like protein
VVDTKILDEPGRLAALHRYEVLDTPREAPFERITGLVRAVLGVPIATLSLIDAERQWFKSCVGLDASETPRNESICTYTIQSREPLQVPDALADPRFMNLNAVVQHPFIRSYLGVPLCSPDGYNLGALCAIDTRARSFSSDQVDVLKSFAALAVDELELRRIAQIDSLTGASTRRSFLLEMEKAIATFVRHRRPCALIVLDIDRFKLVNDTYGHPAGDVVLRTVSRRLEGLLRKEDLIGRLGGEEFGVLLGDTDLDDAVMTAERLRKGLEKEPALIPEPLHVTASFGISQVQPDRLAPEQWLAHADRALYEAKRSGRNRYCVASDEVPA